MLLSFASTSLQIIMIHIADIVLELIRFAWAFSEFGSHHFKGITWRCSGFFLCNESFLRDELGKEKFETQDDYCSQGDGKYKILLSVGKESGLILFSFASFLNQHYGLLSHFYWSHQHQKMITFVSYRHSCKYINIKMVNFIFAMLWLVYTW